MCNHQTFIIFFLLIICFKVSFYTVFDCSAHNTFIFFIAMCQIYIRNIPFSNIYLIASLSKTIPGLYLLKLSTIANLGIIRPSCSINASKYAATFPSIVKQKSLFFFLPNISVLMFLYLYILQTAYTKFRHFFCSVLIVG